MELEREREPLPPPPVLQTAPVPVEPATTTGRKNTRHRLVELEEIARRNLRAAEEARQLVFDEYARLEREASARTEAEHEVAALRRELERLRETDERRTAQARFAVTREVRAEVAGEIKKAQEEHAKVADELARLRGTLDDHDSLLNEYSERLREEQITVASLRAELERADEARRRTEREVVTIREQTQARATDELARSKAAEMELRETRIARDRLQAELDALKADDAVAAMRAEYDTRLDAQAAELARVESALADQTARADAAEQAAAEAQQAVEQAVAAADEVATGAAAARDQLAADGLEAERRAREAEKLLGRLRKEASTSTKARQLAEEALAAAQREIEERSALLDEQQQRIGTLESQLQASRSALEELQAWARTAEAHLAATGDVGAQLEEARSAARHAGEQVARLSDELAAAQGEIELLRTAAAEAARAEAAHADARARAAEVAAEPAAEVVAEPAVEVEPAVESAVEPAVDAERQPAAVSVSEITGEMAAIAATIVESPPRDPEPVEEPAAVEALAAAVEAAPDDDAGAEAGEGARPVEGIRRSAMAELTALAATMGTDDITPRRSR
jgi:ParB family chromosome partitioning protein